MKNQSLTVLGVSIITVLATSCSQDLEENVNNVGNSYVGTVENTVAATRSYNGGDGTFLWNNGDDISVNTATGFQTMKFKSGAGTGTATYESVSYLPKDVAVFPTTAAKSYTGGELIVNYPETLAQSTQVNDPLVAQFGENQRNFTFKHVGGVMAFKVMVPEGVDGFKVTTDKRICGDFKVNTTGDNPVVETEEASTDNSVKFTFTKTTSAGIMYFYLPVPTGTYSSMKVAVLNGETEVKSVTNTLSNTVDRCKWLNFELNFADYTGTIEQVVTGVAAFKELLANTSAADLAQKDICLKLNGETFSVDADASGKTIQTLKVSSLTLENGTVDATGLNITTTGGPITLKNVKMTGAFPKATNGNARISLNTSGTVVVDGVDFTEATSGYNGIEINLSNNPISSNVTVKNCKFGNVPTNNCISIFGMTEGGVVNIENCDFYLNVNADAVRLSNRFNTKFTVNFKDITYKYAGTTTESFLLLQDYTNGANASTVKAFSGLTINCENVYNNGTKVTELGTPNSTDMSKQFAYIWYNGLGVQTDLSHYPTFTFK